MQFFFILLSSILCLAFIHFRSFSQRFYFFFSILDMNFLSKIRGHVLLLNFMLIKANVVDDIYTHISINGYRERVTQCYIHKHTHNNKDLSVWSYFFILYSFPVLFFSFSLNIIVNSTYSHSFFYISGRSTIFFFIFFE